MDNDLKNNDIMTRNLIKTNTPPNFNAPSISNTSNVSNASSISNVSSDFVTPPNHIRFLAKKLFGPSGEILDGAIAYLQPGGGGPTTQHTHVTDHLFIVIRGEAKIMLKDEIKIIRPNESFLVKGSIPHSVWNPTDEETIMIGITLKNPS